MKPPEDIPSSGPRDARSSRGDEAGSGSDRRLTAAAALSASDESPGLPGFRTWRGVYAFVLGIYALWIALLALLTGKFS